MYNTSTTILQTISQELNIVCQELDSELQSLLLITVGEIVYQHLVFIEPIYNCRINGIEFELDKNLDDMRSPLSFQIL